MCGAPVLRIEVEPFGHAMWREDVICLRYILTCTEGHVVYRLTKAALESAVTAARQKRA